jgi:hypothetical protein
MNDRDRLSDARADQNLVDVARYLPPWEDQPVEPAPPPSQPSYLVVGNGSHGTRGMFLLGATAAVTGKKCDIEQVLGPDSSEQFSQLVSLSKKITDYGAEDEVVVDPDAERKDAEIDDELAVAVIFDEEEHLMKRIST